MKGSPRFNETRGEVRERDYHDRRTIEIDTIIRLQSQALTVDNSFQKPAYNIDTSRKSATETDGLEIHGSNPVTMRIPCEHQIIINVSARHGILSRLIMRVTTVLAC